MLNIGQIAKLIYNMGMKKLFSFILSLFFVFFTAQISQAEDYKILVLPDNIQFDSTNYYIFPDSATVFASDTINAIKQDARVQTVSMTEIRDALRKNTKLSILTKKALKEFKYNYNIPFVDFKSIANCFGTNKVLVITSQTDVQNYVLRRTIWDLLNIPGAAVIDPAYRISTYAALIDVDKEQVLWQNTYYKTLATVENRMIAVTFAPATEQLESIKAYSQNFLSLDIAKIVEAKILPPLIAAPKSDGIVDISDVKKESLPKDDTDLQLKTKMPVPTRAQTKNYGETINEL